MDVSPWLRPDAPTSADRLFCHVYGRGEGQRADDPGLAVLVRRRAGARPHLAGPRCWTRSGSAPPTTPPRSPPRQLRDVVDRLIAAGHWRAGDPDIADRVRRRLRRHPPGVRAGRPARRAARAAALRPGPAPARSHRRAARAAPGARPSTAPSSPWTKPGHLARPRSTRPAPTPPATAPAIATSWDRLHPRLTHRGCWIDHDGELPVIEGTLIRLQVEHLPGDRDPKPVWLWSSRTGATADRCGPAAGRRSCAASTLNTPSGCSNRPSAGPPRSSATPHAADRWTWLIIAAHTQLRLARPLAADLRRPWERPAAPGRLTPARVRRGFRNLRAEDPPPRQRTETQPTRPRTPTRLQEPTPRAPPRRRQDRQTRPDHHRPTSSAQVKDQAQTATCQVRGRPGSATRIPGSRSSCARRPVSCSRCGAPFPLG